MDMLFRLPVLAAVVSLLSLPAVASAGVSHLVVPGETLSGIAAANGLSPAQLAGANGLSADAFVIAGRSLTIPPRGATTAAPTSATATPAPFGGYRVRLGDSLSAIAAEHGVSRHPARRGQRPERRQHADRRDLAAAAKRRHLHAERGRRRSTHDRHHAASATGEPAGSRRRPRRHAHRHRRRQRHHARGARRRQRPGTQRLRDRRHAPEDPRRGGPGTAATAATGTATAAANVPATGAATGSPGRLNAAQIGSIAAANGAPASLASAIAWQESGFNNAMVSVANARGIMQVMPSTWSYVQNELGAGRLDPASPADNVRAGSVLLARLLRDTGGDPATAVAAYYQGLGSVRRIGMLPETRRYVANVLALRSRFGG